MSNENIEKLERTILLEAPQLPIITKYLEAAMDVARNNKSEEDYEESLTLAYDMLPFAKIDKEDNFFKYYIIAICLLEGIEGILEMKELKDLETVRNQITDGITIFEDCKQARYKKLSEKLYALVEENIEMFCVMLQYLRNKFADEKTPVDKVLGYAYSTARFMNMGAEIPPVAMGFYNKFLNALGNLDI